jgi:hypothetical protein
LCEFPILFFFRFLLEVDWTLFCEVW